MRGRCVAILVLCGVVALRAQTPKPTFEVASVRKTVQPNSLVPTRTTQNTFYGAGETLAHYIRHAYGLQSFQLVGGPDWVRTDRFEIRAKSEKAASPEQMRLMLQALLEERFSLVLLPERQEMRHLALRVDRGDRLGPNLTECADRLNAPPFKAPRVQQGWSVYGNRCVTLSEVAARASSEMGMPVIDRTGLGGLWDYTVTFVRSPQSSDVSIPREPALLPFDVAMRQQLGLRLESVRGPVDVLVIDSVQQPTEN